MDGSLLRLSTFKRPFFLAAYSRAEERLREGHIDDRKLKLLWHKSVAQIYPTSLRFSFTLDAGVVFVSLTLKLMVCNCE